MIEIVDRETGELLDADSVPGLAEIAALHHAQLAKLTEAVEDLADGTGMDPQAANGPRRPIVWSRLTGSDLERTWTALADWVGWLRGRYPLANQVPLCWWRHPELVEELSALWLAWREAYLEKGAPLTAGADWHARCLPDLLRRIRAGGWNIACESEHRDSVASLYDARSVDAPEDFAQRISAPGTREPSITGGEVMDVEEMDAALRAGAATRLGGLPDSPVELRGEFWCADGATWVRVESPEVTAYLTDAQRRLAIARETDGQADAP
jgi:hypothetical protein